MSVVRVQLKLKKQDLNPALRKLAAVSDRLPSYLANKACNQVAFHAEAAMPVVSVARIDAELESRDSQVEMHTGVSFNRSNNPRNRNLTLKERIVLARMHPNSKYNLRTGGVWKLNRPSAGALPYAGGGTNRIRFWTWVEETAERMHKARRSSKGFFKFGATVIKFLFYGVVKGKAPVRPPSDLPGTMSEAQPYGGKVGQAIGRVAGGMPATEGSAVATARFWVSATEPDSKGMGGAGFKKVAEPVWQSAANKEATATRAYAEKLYVQAAMKSGIKVT